MTRKAATLLFSALLMISSQLISAQTRPRRAEQSPNNPSVPVAEDVIRIDTTLVSVPVSVTDRNGVYIPDLNKEDFHIYEDGVEQEIAYFAAVEKPFTVLLVLDTSASTWSKLGEIKDAAKAFVAELRPDDQVMVIAFGMGIKVQSEPTSDRRKIIRGIESTGRGLSTHLYDAMDKVMTTYLNRIQGRKAVVLFTDGVDATSNDATYESTTRFAEELDALIYSIRYDTYDPAADNGPVAAQMPPIRLPGILRRLPLPFPTIGGSSGSTGGGPGSTREDYDRGEQYLQDLATLTGGRVYEADKDLRNLKIAFSNIAQELGRQYSVGYYPQQKGKAGARRRIKIKVDRSDVAVRARDGYIYKGI